MENPKFFQENYDYVNNDYLIAYKVQLSDRSIKEFQCNFDSLGTTQPGNHGSYYNDEKGETLMEYVLRAENYFKKRVIAVKVKFDDSPDRSGGSSRESSAWWIVEKEYDYLKLRRRVRDKINKCENILLIKIADLLGVNF